MSLLYRAAELRHIEQAASRDLAPGTLMERAGHAAARWLHQWLNSPGASFLVLCGPGNNGGDGFVCARVLRELGHHCTCWAPADSGSRDAAAARSAWIDAGGAIDAVLPKERRFDVIVDAMFGIGLARALAEPYLGAARWAAHCGARLVALDVPSGLDSDTGAWVGGVEGIAAHFTVTFLGDKPGLHMGDGCDAAGPVHTDTLGVGEWPAQGRLNSPEYFAPLLRPRAQNSHKGTFGSLAVIGGAAGMLGAPLLAARAALRLGAGRVYLSCIGQADFSLDPACPELMIRPFDALPQTQAVVIGCGLGTSPEALRVLQHVLALPCLLVLDADALNLVSGQPTLKRSLAERSAAKILTPHPLEAARLRRGSDAAKPDADRIEAAVELARAFRATVVLKGAGSVIVDAGGDTPSYYINPTGGPALATAGTGDVLSGMIGAHIAQGHGALAATLGAVWLHGRAAQLHGADLGLLASEVPLLAARALARLRRQD